MQVLEEHDLSCVELLHVKSDGVVLTKQSMSTRYFQAVLELNFHTYYRFIILYWLVFCWFIARNIWNEK
jgi:hypothetical protein